MIPSLLYTYQEMRRTVAEYFSPGLRSRITPKDVKVPELARDFLEKNTAYIKEYTFIHSVAETYFRGRIADDWCSIQRIVPPETKSILDLGSGVGGLDILLYHALSSPDLHLVDKAAREDDGGSIKRNVIMAARELLMANAVPAEKINTFDSASPDLMEQLARKKYDFVLSTRGLGFMFPYSIYQDLIRKNLVVGGIMIIDILKVEDVLVDQHDVVKKRFEKDGLPSSRFVLQAIESDFGAPPHIMYQNERLMRIWVKKNI